jgi:polyketide synthase PksM
VYVVIGGAGGIGTAWSAYMIRTYGAHVIWIGRRQIDTAIQANIAALARLGPAPRYLSADARDPEALQRAYEAIKQQHDRIHGVVHSAIVLLDQSLANMDEERFRAAFSTKADICAALAQVFRAEPLDFVLFFSALTGFFKPAGQSNYAAGCTFQDAFAHWLAREWTGPDGRPAIKIMNWGYWGSVGVVASQAYRDRTARAGIGSIEPPEAMQALETLLAAPVHQLALWKTIGASVEPEAFVTVYPDTLPSLAVEVQRRVCPDPRTSVTLLTPQDLTDARQMDELLGRLLLAQLRALGVFAERRPAPLLAAYERWLAESLAVLVCQGHLRYDEIRRACVPVSDTAGPADDALAAAWRRWDEHKGIWLANPGMRASVILVETTMRALADILTGKRRATDVMFPDASMTLVEGTNRRNKIADFFNGVLADTVIAYIRKRQARGTEPLRLLEIGAGTGSTSAMVLAKLRALHGHPVREYCYSDISRGFLLYGEKEYGPANPFLTYRIFNVEEPLAAQGMPVGAFDLVIAANVLHATANIRHTLRNAKVALKKHGLLLLNEMSANTLFSHLTYGLLEGWWSYNDAELRLPGCPGLSPEAWRSVLEEAGFNAVFFPADHVADAGLQVIVAESDGIVYQRTRPDPGPLSRGERLQRGSEGRADRAPDEMLEAHIRDTIIRKLSEALQIDMAKIDVETPFADYGIDSITGVHLVQVLNSLLKTNLETISLFDYSTVNALTGYVLAQYGDAVRATLSPAVTSARAQDPTSSLAPALHSSPQRGEGRPLSWAPSAHAVAGGGRGDTPPDDAIAVVGMSARFARSPHVKALWQNLVAGADLVQEVSRWELSRYYPHSAASEYCRHGSFLDDIGRFDPSFFNISGLEANYMDPQQRLFLEECWKALEDAGYAGGESAVQRFTMATTSGERRCGVYVGWCGVDYAFLLGDNPPPQAHWGTTGSVIPARIAYFLDLHGPAVAVDTACSSSLVAVHLACRGLLAGEMDLALAGGVSIQTTPASFLAPNRGGMLSHTGRCYTFDERADGFVLGEGVGVVVLKRLADAVAARDNIYGVIRGSALNQDGKTNGITAPSARSQERLAREVYDTFHIHADRIGMVEAHGTGTRLGDPIEFEALTRAFRKDTDRTQYCAIGSIKTNLGHTIAAAGVAGLIKVLLALQHKKIPASLHYRQVNPHINFADSPFYVNTRLRDWEAVTDAAGRPYPRLAVLSSFGFSGTNAHMAVEEAPAIERRHADPGT